MDAYERILGDAMAGDAKIFAREDYGEEARRIVDPILKASASVLEYDKGAWGSGETEQSVFPHGRSDSPTAADQDDFRFAAEFA
jgi:glucose-6-phosphate 1-dehydrogenase